MPEYVATTTPTTREEIRAEAIERVARAMYERAPNTIERWESAYLAPEIRAAFRKWAEPLVDALGDLLPTSVYEELSGGFTYGAGQTIDDYPPTFTVRTYSCAASLDGNADYAAYVQWHHDRGTLTPEEWLAEAARHA